jgi:type I restriction enzyme M protein
MAKKITEIKPIEVTLWDAANKLRGSVESAEYKHVVLGLIFLKFASDKFEAHREKLIAEGKAKYVEMSDFYNKDNVFFLKEESRWSYLIKRAKQSDIALLIDTTLHTIEKDNETLRGALPDNYFSRLGLDITKLASLLDTINDIDTLKDPKQDVVGRVYEYFLSKFALAEGKGKGEFYTPKQSVKFIEAHNGNKREVSIYGQEYTNTTYKLAKMNLAIRGIAGNLGDKAANTFLDDQHRDLKADYIMANPPFNQKD